MKSFASCTSHRVVLTGTPVQNSVLELWPLFHFLMPNLLGTQRSFDLAYSRPVRTLRAAGTTSTRQMREDYIVAIEDLHLRVAPFIMRREKADVLQDLPPKVIQDVHCMPSPEQTRLHDLFSQSSEGRRAKAQLDELRASGKKSATQISPSIPKMVGLQYLRMLCSHPYLVSDKIVRRPGKAASAGAVNVDVQESGKMMALLRLFAEAGIGNGFMPAETSRSSSPHLFPSSSSPESARCSTAVVSFRPPKTGWPHKFLVFAHFRSTLNLLEHSVLHRHMPGVEYVRLDGTVSPLKRGEVVDRFNRW